MEARTTSKSAISHSFIQGTEQKLAELFGRDLSQLDLVAIFIEGVEIAEHCVVVALGIDAEGASTRSACGKAPLRTKQCATRCSAT